MAQSAQYAIAAHVASLLAAAPALASGNVQQNRSFGLANGVAAQVHVNFSDSSPQSNFMGIDSPLDHETTIEIVVLTRKSGATEAPAAADAIWTEAYARVMADQSLGGRAWALVPGPVISRADEADTSVNRLEWTFTAKHRTTNNVITP